MNENEDTLTKLLKKEITVQTCRKFFLEKVNQEEYHNINNVKLYFFKIDPFLNSNRYLDTAFLGVRFNLYFNDNTISITKNIDNYHKSFSPPDIHEDLLLPGNIILRANFYLRVPIISLLIKKEATTPEQINSEQQQLTEAKKFYRKTLLQFLTNFPVLQIPSVDDAEKCAKKYINYDALMKNQNFVKANIYNEEIVSLKEKEREFVMTHAERRRKLIEVIPFVETKLLSNLQNKYGLKISLRHKYTKEEYGFLLTTKLSCEADEYTTPFTQGDIESFITLFSVDAIFEIIFKKVFVSNFPVFHSVADLVSIDIEKEDGSFIPGLMDFLKKGEINNIELSECLKKEKESALFVHCFNELKNVIQQENILKEEFKEKIENNTNKLIYNIVDNDINMDELSSFL